MTTTNSKNAVPIENPYLTQPYELLDRYPETEIDHTFVLAYDGPLKSGQFFQLSVPGVGEAPISVSDFKDGKLYMTIRKVGRVTDALFELKPGAQLHMRGPYGNGFDLGVLLGRDVIVVTGGTGLAPVKHLIGNLMARRNELNSLNILMGFKSTQDILFADELTTWAKTNGVNAQITLDTGTPEWKGLTGLVTQHILSFGIPDLKAPSAVVVGPPMMMKFTTLELLKQGVSPDHLWVSFERNMSCGIGKCGHCKIDETYVCLEGPVFPYEKARFLLD